MIKRILTTVVGLPIVVLVFAYGNKYIMDVILALVAIVGMHEYMKCISHNDVKPIKWIGYLAAACIAGIHLVPFNLLPTIFTFAIPTVLLILFLHVIVTNMKITFEDMSYTFFGMMYILPLISFVALLYGHDGDITGKVLIWYMFCAAWGCDTCAYLAGVSIGKHKFSKVSPKKSIEGCIAGVIGAALIGLLYTVGINMFLGLEVSYLVAGLICAGLSIIGQVGDFAASVIKRHFEVKDYSNIFPGHGGMLDRIDSVMFIAPFAYLLLTLFI